MWIDVGDSDLIAVAGQRCHTIDDHGSLAGTLFVITDSDERAVVHVLKQLAEKGAKTSRYASLSRDL